jgi:hypothetical protein
MSSERKPLLSLGNTDSLHFVTPKKLKTKCRILINSIETIQIKEVNSSGKQAMAAIEKGDTTQPTNSQGSRMCMKGSSKP